MIKYTSDVDVICDGCHGKIPLNERVIVIKTSDLTIRREYYKNGEPREYDCGQMLYESIKDDES